MRKLFLLLLTLLLLLPAAAPCEGEALIRLPDVVDRLHSPNALPGFDFPEDAEVLEVLFPQIYDADAALIRSGGEVILLDCGTGYFAWRILRVCELYGIERIDRLIITHPHHDHIGGIDVLSAEIPIGEMDVCFPENFNAHMVRAVGYCEKAGIPVRLFADGDLFTVGDAVLRVYLKADESWSVNNRSAVIRLEYGARTMLFTADIEKKAIARLLEALPAEALRADILKFPHHGVGAIGNAFYEAVSPELSIITCNGRATNGQSEAKRKGWPYALTVPGIIRLRTDGSLWLAERTHTADATAR